MNILTTSTPEHWKSFISELESVEFERNFEQILAMVKNGEINKVCIIMDVWNVAGKSFNGMRGQNAAEKIHEINPNVPILIWDGREFESDIVIPPCFQVEGNLVPIKKANELYLSFDNYDDDQMLEITAKFFDGVLTSEDALEKECIGFPFYRSIL
jgi:hypothetical protein